MSRRTERPTIYNEAAEMAVVGAMMYRPDCREEVFDQLTASDFWQSDVSDAFVACKNLFDRGLVSDAVTVQAELAGRVEPARLVEMVNAVPSSRNIGSYVAKVQEFATRRALLEYAQWAGGYSREGQGSAGELLEKAREEFEVLQGGQATSDVFPETVRMVDFLDSHQDVEEYAPEVIPGLIRVGGKVLIVAPEGAGKGLALDTPLPTPTGWTTMGDVQHGDVILGGDGRPCSVLGTSGINHRPCYRVVLSDGAELIADDEHLWHVADTEARQRKDGSHSVVTTIELRDRLWCGNRHNRHWAVPVVTSELPEADLPVDPYVLGAWLGDGSTRSALMHCRDQEIRDEFTRRGYTAGVVSDRQGWRFATPGWEEAERLGVQLVSQGHSTHAAAKACGLNHDTVGRHAKEAGHVLTKKGRHLKWGGPAVAPLVKVQTVLGGMGLTAGKFVPMEYKRASLRQRLELLAGLVDTDGHVQSSGGCEVTLCNERLARDAAEMVRSVGWKASIKESAALLNGREVGRRWRIWFCPDERLPLAVPYKRDRIRSQTTQGRNRWRYVVAVEPVEPVPTKCIAVDSSDSTYLAGPELVKTHNSVLLRQLAILAAGGVHPFTLKPIEPVRTMVIDLENQFEAIQELCRPMYERWVADHDNCWLVPKEEGIDLRNRADRLGLEATIRQFRPQLVVMGPVYKMVGAVSSMEEATAMKEVMLLIDRLRKRYGVAFVLEHHMPHSDGMDSKLRPAGTSLWKRWPNMGLAMSPVETDDDSPPTSYRLSRFRKDRLKNDWPSVIVRASARLGGVQPWLPGEASDADEDRPVSSWVPRGPVAAGERF